MKDDVCSLFDFNRWADERFLETCRQVSPGQLTSAPSPGWSSIHSTLVHIAAVKDAWLRALAEDPDDSFATEEQLPAIDDVSRLLEHADQTWTTLRPSLTPERLETPFTMSRYGRTLSLPPWVILRHVVNHSTYHRGQLASKLKRFGVEAPSTDFVFWALRHFPQPS